MGVVNLKYFICDALRDLVPYAQFKKREKYPWRSVTFGKVAGCCRLKPATLLKITLLHGCFLPFLNRTNGTKSRKASHIFKQEEKCFNGSACID